MNRIYLIRHGLTEANRRHLYCGSTDLPLSPEGERQLAGFKHAYPRPENALFVTSGMLRTGQTLALLFGDVPYLREPGFREMDFGRFEMHSYEELKGLPEYQSWLAGDNEANIPPQGESGRSMQERVLRAFFPYRQSDRDVVIITHGGPIAAVMSFLFPFEGKNRYQWQPKPGHGYLIHGENYRPCPENERPL